MPAHFRLHGDITRSTFKCRIVQGAASSSVEVRSIEENAGIVDETCRDRAVFVSFGDATCPFGLELPFFVAERRCPTFDFSNIFVINEVRAIRTAALDQLLCGTSEDALTSIAKDAGPVARQERHIKDPRSFFGSIGKADPFVKVGWEIGSHGGRGYPEPPQVEDALWRESAHTLEP